MTRAVRVLRRAQGDVQRIHALVAREAPLRADSFIDGLLDAIQSLGADAERGARPRDATLRQRGYRYPVYRRRYLIVFKVVGKQVQVHRVLHGKRAYRDIL